MQENNRDIICGKNVPYTWKNIGELRQASVSTVGLEGSI
jgi:hypothetical protein